MGNCYGWGKNIQENNTGEDVAWDKYVARYIVKLTEI